jgi:hypothetical protein
MPRAWKAYCWKSSDFIKISGLYITKRKWSERHGYLEKLRLSTCTQFVGFCRYHLHGLTNSCSINGYQLFSELYHQALYIFWIIIVAGDLPFQVSPEIFDRPLGRIQFLALLIGPTYPFRSVQTLIQVWIRFFPFCGVFG